MIQHEFVFWAGGLVLQISISLSFIYTYSSPWLCSMFIFTVDRVSDGLMFGFSILSLGLCRVSIVARIILCHVQHSHWNRIKCVLWNEIKEYAEFNWLNFTVYTVSSLNDATLCINKSFSHSLLTTEYRGISVWYIFAIWPLEIVWIIKSCIYTVP